jgi:glutamate-ammonia-ligase adenylyltransferase
MTGSASEPLHLRISEAPVSDAANQRGADLLSEIIVASRDDATLEELGRLAATEPIRGLLSGIAAGSSYLTGLIRRDFHRLQGLLLSSPEQRLTDISAALAQDLAKTTDIAGAMRLVRAFKNEAALLIALADISGAWGVMRVTEALSDTADVVLQGAVRFLFRMAVERGDWLSVGDVDPAASSGLIVLGMGKYGALELNYSSDIDLIVFFESEKAKLKEGLDPQAFFVRLTRDLVRIMDERTGDGYVFRTDLRLRPDAGATQVAISTEAALIYYESFGQNWERAALIKARPVAGDFEAGSAFLAELAPFIWRKYLDYAAISDIHAMKRQIHAFRGFGGISIPGHNIKLGPGGIREIEFFAQTQQLIAGGRQRDIRQKRTLDTLERLVARGWIKQDVATDLEAAYLFLRRLEHRLQMVGDEQTHELPEDHDALLQFAHFAGFRDLETFTAKVTSILAQVQKHYAVLFEGMPELTSSGANMVFAGEEDDPGTLSALAAMGYSQPSQVIATVRSWHHGRYPAVRSPKARERLTEVQPLLISELADTADPDQAFASFDRFLSELPSGVQLFSLLRANPGLLKLVADIMGTAPRLARILSKRRRLLDAVLDPRIFGTLPTAADLDRLIESELQEASDMQDILDRCRVIGSEQAFLVGVRVLSGAINASQAGGAYAQLAERLIARLQKAVEKEMARAHGTVRGAAAAVLGMGKLGGREMTANSDIDLIVIYDFDPEALQSDGARPLSPPHFYTRLTQRLINALSAPTAEGTLYEVDMRLRPSGQKGPVATQLSSFIDYQAKEAWTWEHMALTRARVITGNAEFRKKVEEAIRATLMRPRNRAKIAADVHDMRARIFAEKGTQDFWDMKQVRGGLVDLEFIVQFLQLVRAAEHPEVLDPNTLTAFHKLEAAGDISSADAAHLMAACRLIHDLTQITRLCQEGAFNPATASKGLRELLCRAGDAPSFSALEAKLAQILARTKAIYDRLIV